MAGLRQDANLRIQGRGSWTRWDGRLAATLDSEPVVDLKLAARSGAYAATGTIEGRAMAGQGLVQRLSAPRLAMQARGSMAHRVLEGKHSPRSEIGKAPGRERRLMEVAIPGG